MSGFIRCYCVYLNARVNFFRLSAFDYTHARSR